MSLRGKVKFAEISDTGKVREHNEDAIGSNIEVGLMVLADGMGGYNAGEVASGIAVQTITELATAGANRETRNDIDQTTGLMRQSIVLRDAVARANKIIFQTAQSQTHCEGMGTTLVAAMFYDNRISLAHVGDSRAYRLRGDRFEQLTLDHSLLQELVDRGFYSEEEAQRSTNRNYVTRALGVEPTVEVEVQMLKGISKVESKIKSNLVIPASARVKLPTKWSNELGKTSLNAHMYIFVFYLPRMSARSNVFSNFV
jgi:protein phosphatase